MIVESLVIIIICICIIYIFIRSGNANYAIAATPVMAVPFFQILAYPLRKVLQSIWVNIPDYVIFLGFNLVGLAVASFMIALFSFKFQQKRNKNMYIFSVGVYSLILTGVFISYHIGKII